MTSEFKCRVCEGWGQVVVAEQTSRHPADVREFELACPDCGGEGTVDQDTHDEQQQYSDGFYEAACQEALELYWDEVREMGCI